MTIHSSDFAWPSDDALIKSLTTYERRPNLMIVARGLPVEAVADQVITLCARPILPSLLPGRLNLPARRNGTIVLQNVTSLSRPQQITLDDWIVGGCGDIQIVSIATMPLWPLVQNGDFLEGLFYRLNIVRLDATAESFIGAGLPLSEHPHSPRA
jgi:hypothetical protein